MKISIFYALAGAALSQAQTVDLGSAGSYGALAPAGVTNTGITIITGDIGSTGTSITGFPPGVYTGTEHLGDAEATAADADRATAYLQGQQLTPTVDEAGLTTLAGLVLTAGVYNFDAAVTLDGILTLNGPGTFVFQLASTLTTITGSSVLLTGGASACDVYWIVGTAATLGTNSVMVGNILTSTAITATTGASIQGGLYAGSAVTLDTNTIVACDATTPVSSSSSSSSSTASSSSLASSSVSSLSSSSSVVPASTTSSTVTKTTATSTPIKPTTTSTPTKTSSKTSATSTKKSSSTSTGCTTSSTIAKTTFKTSTTCKKTTTTKTTSTAKATSTSTSCPNPLLDPIGYALCILEHLHL